MDHFVHLKKWLDIDHAGHVGELKANGRSPEADRTLLAQNKALVAMRVSQYVGGDFFFGVLVLVGFAWLNVGFGFPEILRKKNEKDILWRILGK